MSLKQSCKEDSSNVFGGGRCKESIVGLVKESITDGH